MKERTKEWGAGFAILAMVTIGCVGGGFALVAIVKFATGGAWGAG